MCKKRKGERHGEEIEVRNKKLETRMVRSGRLNGWCWRAGKGRRRVCCKQRYVYIFRKMVRMKRVVFYGILQSYFVKSIG